MILHVQEADRLTRIVNIHAGVEFLFERRSWRHKVSDIDDGNFGEVRGETSGRSWEWTCHGSVPKMRWAWIAWEMLDVWRCEWRSPPKNPRIDQNEVLVSHMGQTMQCFLKVSDIDDRDFGEVRGETSSCRRRSWERTFHGSVPKMRWTWVAWDREMLGVRRCEWHSPPKNQRAEQSEHLAYHMTLWQTMYDRGQRSCRTCSTVTRISNVHENMLAHHVTGVFQEAA